MVHMLADQKFLLHLFILNLFIFEMRAGPLESTIYIANSGYASLKNPLNLLIIGANLYVYVGLP